MSQPTTTHTPTPLTPLHHSHPYTPYPYLCLSLSAVHVSGYAVGELQTDRPTERSKMFLPTLPKVPIYLSIYRSTCLICLSVMCVCLLVPCLMRCLEDMLSSGRGERRMQKKEEGSRDQGRKKKTMLHRTTRQLLF